MCFIKECLFAKAQNFCHLIDEPSFYNKKMVSKIQASFIWLLNDELILQKSFSF